MRRIFSQDRPETFRCLNCGEVINTAVAKCRFCGLAVDHEAALAAAGLQKTFDCAYAEARTLKIMSLMLGALYAASWLPVVGDLVSTYLFVPLILICVMQIRWWVIYYRIRSNDKVYQRADLDCRAAALIWVLVAECYWW